MKARIDWMESGKVLLEPMSYAFVSRTMGKYITTSGGTANGSVSGQHVTEYDIITAGKSYVFKYWRPSSSTQVCIAFLNESGTMISAIYGGSSGQRTATYTVPAGTKKVLVYGIYRTGNLVYSSMTPTVAEGSANVEEIRVRAEGDSVSQIVWPTKPKYSLTNVTRHYTGQRNYIEADGSTFAYATADIIITLGTQVTTLTNQTLTPKRITVNDHLVIDNVDTKIFYIDGNYIKAKNLKTAEAPGGTACTATFGYEDQEVDLYIEQDHNYIEEQFWRPNSITTTGYKIELSQSDFPTSGGSAKVTGYRVFRGYLLNWWTSTATTDVGWATGYEEKDPTSITCSGASVLTDTVYFPSNSGTDAKTYTVTGRWGSYSGTATAIVAGTESGRTYSNLSVTLSYAKVSGQNYHIPASGGSIYPTVSVSIKCNGTTMTGSVSDGSTSVTVSGGGLTTTVLLEFSEVDNKDVPGGRVAADSRGTNEDAGNTTLAMVSVTARKTYSGGTLTRTTTSQSVYQQRNMKSVSAQGNFHVTALTITPMLGDTAISGNISPLPQTVTLSVTASGSGTTTTYSYTSGATSGGNSVPMTDEPLTREDLASLTLDDAPLTGLTFEADNKHNTSNKTYTIKASYEDSGIVTVTVTQNKDEKQDAAAPTYTCTLEEVVNSNTLGASGGKVQVLATAYHELGKVWASDGAAVEGETTTISDVDYITLAVSQAADYFTVNPVSTGTYTKTYEITHRDMEENYVTDSISVKAQNGGNAESDTLTYSITNTEQGGGDEPEPEPEPEPGSHILQWDSTRSMWRLHGSFAATGFVESKNIGTDGQTHVRWDDVFTYDSTDKVWTLTGNIYFANGLIVADTGSGSYATREDDDVLSWDSGKSAWRFNGAFYATGYASGGMKYNE